MFYPTEIIVTFVIAIFLICVLVTVEAEPMLLHPEGFVN